MMVQTCAELDLKHRTNRRRDGRTDLLWQVQRSALQAAMLTRRKYSEFICTFDR